MGTSLQMFSMDVVRGPGRLAAALRIDHRLDGLDLCREGTLWLGPDDREQGQIGAKRAVGIAQKANRLLRFYLVGREVRGGKI
jgi:DNA-3-methyladenine glycosylase